MTFTEFTENLGGEKVVLRQFVAPFSSGLEMLTDASIGWADAALEGSKSEGYRLCSSPEAMALRIFARSESPLWKQGDGVGKGGIDTLSIVAYGRLRGAPFVVFCHDPNWVLALQGLVTTEFEFKNGLDYIREVIRNTYVRGRKDEDNIKLVDRAVIQINERSFERIIDLVPKGPCRFEGSDCDKFFSSPSNTVSFSVFETHPETIAFANGNRDLVELYKRKVMSNRYHGIGVYHPEHLDERNIILCPLTLGSLGYYTASLEISNAVYNLAGRVIAVPVQVPRDFSPPLRRLREQIESIIGQDPATPRGLEGKI